MVSVKLPNGEAIDARRVNAVSECRTPADLSIRLHMRDGKVIDIACASDMDLMETRKRIDGLLANAMLENRRSTGGYLTRLGVALLRPIGIPDVLAFVVGAAIPWVVWGISWLLPAAQATDLVIVLACGVTALLLLRIATASFMARRDIRDHFADLHRD